MARRILLAFLMLALIGVAGIFVYRSLVDELRGPVRADGTRAGDIENAPGSPQSAAGAPGVGGPVVVRTPLWVMAGEKGAGGRPLVALGSPVCEPERPFSRDARRGILARELVRQAVLIAARDELGLSTRDQVLGDQAAAGPGNERFELATEFAPAEGGQNRISLRRITQGRVESLLDHELQKPEASLDDPAKLAEVAEAMSRTEIPGVLKKLGLEGKPNSLRADAGLPGELEQRLAGLSFTEVFSAVRDLHAMIRADGESPERLGGLIRGCALLGLLTEFQWHPAHKAFKARALLYAERLLARNPKAPWGYWHRAYARALVGLEKNALADLASAQARAKEAEGTATPDWVELIDAYARCDARRLQVLVEGDGPRAKLAALLRLMVLEYPPMPNLTLQSARKVVEFEPDCYRSIDAMCRVMGVSNMHVATMLAPQALDQVLPAKLRAVSQLPAEVRNLLDHPAGGEAALVNALAQSGLASQDAGEPSWSVLSHLIRETRFAAVLWRLVFMRYMWNVPADEFWAESQVGVADHPLRPLLEAIALSPPQGGPAFSTIVDHLDLANLEITEFEMFRLLSRFAPAQARGLWALAESHADPVARDLSILICAPAGREAAFHQADFARTLLSVSPHSACARATLIEKDWDNVKGEVAQWEKEDGDAPTVLAALARHHAALKKYDEAGNYLARYIKLSPDSWAFELLAQNFKDQGNVKGWQETLEKYIETTEDTGLEHARIRVEIANSYMAQKEWDKAWPYAGAAAETFAQWAIACAQRCAEAREDWEQALLWAQRESERYPVSSWWKWFLFCKRTGKGDVKAAQAVAEEGILSSSPQNDRLGWFYWLCHDGKKALPHLRQMYAQQPSVDLCNTMIMAADDLGDVETREEFYRMLTSQYKDQAPKGAKIWEIFHVAFESKDRAAIDVKSVDQIVESIPADSRWYTEFYVGVFLTNHGDKADARRYLERVKVQDANPWRRALVGDCLLRLGVDPTRSESQPPAE